MKARTSFLLGMLGLLSYGAAHAQSQPTCTFSGCTITMSGSYLLANGISGLNITANDVVLDLNGFTVTQNPQPAISCPIVVGTAGNSCTSGSSGNPAITISGSNVTIKNGTITTGFGTGIRALPPANTSGNLVLRDLMVANFRGAGIDVSNEPVVRLINVQSNQNGGYGILGNTGVMLSNVTANYNNLTGIQLNSGVLEDVTTNFNKGGGILSAGTIVKAHAENNGGFGIYGGAVIRDSYASGNVGDGFNSGTFGVITNSIANFNGGHGFNFSGGACYWGLSTTGNTGTAIAGGTPLTGSTASCQ